MKIVFLDAGTLGDDIDYSGFEQMGEVVKYPFSSPEEASRRVADADVVIVNKVPVNSMTISSAENLKLVCVTATGTNNLDKDYLAQRGIAWRNVAGYSTESVAQHTFAMLFYLMENLRYYDDYVRDGHYINDRIFTHFARTFHELNGMTWGILGLGAIGRRVADIAAMFGARVIYYSASGAPAQKGYNQVNFDTLLAESDILSVHAPLNEYTEGIMDAEAFRRMKSSAILLNLGRGPIINEADLAEEAQASVLFVRKDAPAHVGGTRRIVSLENLKAFRFTATTPGGLASWLAAEGLLSRRGILPSELAPRTVFQGNDPSAVLDVVLKHPNTIGVLPACVLEGLEREGRVKIEAELQILNPRHGDGLACLHTTPAYPGWAFAALTTTDPAWKKAVSSLLFGMTRTGYGGEWTMPTLNRSIYDLFYELQIGPYEHLASWSFERFMRENAEGLALAVLGAFLVVTYSVSLSVMVRRKTRQLRRALAERDLIEAQAAQSRQHIANLERTGIVGQMSTIIAHELKQPLSAIMNYANGLHRRSARGRFEQESFLWALDEIVNEAERASEIVNRVRSYARHEYPPRAVTDLSEVIGNSISTFRRSRQTKAEIVVRVNEGSMAEVDAWEIELAVLNLLKNAADAVSGIESPRIEVLLEPADAKTWALSVADNGPRLTDEELSRFFQPLQTTKGAKGLGLGLSIVANIAERHAGRITVERATPECGVRFVFTFPRVARAEEDLAELGLPPKLEVFDETTPRG